MLLLRTVRPFILAPIAALVVLTCSGGHAAAQDVRVTVVAILASDRHQNVDSKLQALAAEIKKRDDRLTGFKIDRTTSKPLAIGQKDTFQLISDLTADVTLVQRDEKDNKVRLTVKAPHVGEITYSTSYGKYFPIMTRYQTEKEKEWLILAVMATNQPPKAEK